MTRVLVLDGHQRSALAVTRSLGRRGVYVVVADESSDCLAAASRYCAARAIYASPMAAPHRFVENVAALVREYRIDVLIPATDSTTELILQHREKFKAVTKHLPSLQAYEALSDKARLLEIAAQVGVTAPRSILVAGGEDQLESACQRIGFPAVLKPVRSRLWVGVKRISASVRVVKTLDEAVRYVRCEQSFRVAPYLVQAFVLGTGQGVFAIYDRGQAVSFFAHRRLRERPRSGGVSVLSESTELEPVATVSAKKILDTLHWHGVAMVEFRRGDDGVPYLIEANGRFWGSLQLSVDAGVDFPFQILRLAVGEPAEKASWYRVGVCSRWLVGDLEALCLDLRGRRVRRIRDLWAVCRLAGEFLVGTPPGTMHDVNRWEDPRPFLHDLRRLLMRRG